MAYLRDSLAAVPGGEPTCVSPSAPRRRSRPGTASADSAGHSPAGAPARPETRSRSRRIPDTDKTVAPVPAGLWARIVQRLLALNACIWHNWMIGAPVKRSLIAYDH